MRLEFSAQSIVCYVEDDVCVASFADSASAEPDNYLIVSQLLLDDEDDTPSIEYSIGGEGECVNVIVEFAQLDAKAFRMDVNEGQIGARQFLINLDCPMPPDLPEHLERIFSKSSTSFTLGARA